MLFAVFVPTWIMLKSGCVFGINLILFSISSIVAPLKYLNLASCLSVLRRSSLIQEIIQSSTIATVPFGHFLISSALLLSLLLTKLVIGWLDSLLCDLRLPTCFSRCFLYSITLSGFSLVSHVIDLTKTIYQVRVAQSFFSVLSSVIMMLKVGGDSVNFKVVESLLLCNFCMVRCLTISWFLRSKFSFSKREILTCKFVFLKFSSIFSVSCL